jgi:hypothetical protein
MPKMPRVQNSQKKRKSQQEKRFEFAISPLIPNRISEETRSFSMKIKSITLMQKKSTREWKH